MIRKTKQSYRHTSPRRQRIW